MTTWFYTVWLALSGDLERYVTAALEYRRVETEIYRSRLGKKFMTTRDERQRLLAAALPPIGKMLPSLCLGDADRKCYIILNAIIIMLPILFGAAGV